MKYARRNLLNIFILLGCTLLMSFTVNDPVSVPEPQPISQLFGWSNMSCVPTGNGAIELSCKQCYYVLFIAVDCRDCINYVGSTNNRDCKDL